MTTDEVKKVAVIGAGTMGLGIAQLSAMAGHDTRLYDLTDDALGRAIAIITQQLDKGIERGKLTEQIKQDTLAGISVTTSLDEIQADLVVEAVIEKLEVKHEVLSAIQNNNPEAIIATNTSSIPITKIAAGLPRPERLVGMHFFNPAHIMKLVEVIKGAASDDELVKTVFELAERWGKKAVIAKDAPGFIVNRVARQYYVEALKIAEEGVADIESIDALMESNGFRMGPFRLMDLIGVDTNFSVTQSMFNAFHQDGKFRPSRIQEQKVMAEHHGKKTGKGFYDYN